MNVDISLDVKGVAAALKKTQAEITAMIPRALFATAVFGTNNIIKDRTKQGIGINGKFKAYSPEYAKFKAKKGHPKTVNLTYSGKMLGSMSQAKVSNTAVKIYFTNAVDAKKAAFNNKTRPFFGFNNAEKQRLQKFFVGRFK